MKNPKKQFTSRSIYIAEEDFGIDKRVNDLAKKDKNIPIDLRKKKSSLVSMITIGLWKKYIQEQQE